MVMVEQIVGYLKGSYTLGSVALICVGGMMCTGSGGLGSMTFGSGW